MGYDISIGIGQQINYVDYSLFLKNNATNVSLWSYSYGANNAKSIGDSCNFR